VRSWTSSLRKNRTINNLDFVSHQDRQSRIWTYIYDANRRLTSVTDPAGEQTQFGYNHAGKLTSLTDPKSYTTNWTYDIEGRLIGKQYVDASTVTYTYETTTSWLKSVTDALSQVKTYAYAGRPASPTPAPSTRPPTSASPGTPTSRGSPR
jgi:YD repeat-containing protein